MLILLDIDGVMMDQFIIIDDDKTLNGLPAKLKQHLILTQSTVGLTKEDTLAIALGS